MQYYWKYFDSEKNEVNKEIAEKIKGYFNLPLLIVYGEKPWFYLQGLLEAKFNQDQLVSLLETIERWGEITLWEEK
ncbi:MAG: hypothetical protein KC483_10825 [Nitrosarchaeum sp.]|nr:hypothetical protein [Nitrosarchaeum sp.]